MLESNVFRMIMFIGAIIVVGILLDQIIGDGKDIIGLLKAFFHARIQKY